MGADTGSAGGVVVFDRFHVQRLAHDALDKVRREQVRELAGTDDAWSVKNTRFALQKNPWNLSQSDHETGGALGLVERLLVEADTVAEICA
jgi:transposase